MTIPAITRGATDERGAVSVLVALVLGTLMMLLVWFVIDVGIWFDHQRHLQLQADAGALAGAQSFAISCSNTTITNASRQYAGLPSNGVAYTTPYNAQIGSGNPNITWSFNQDLYPDSSQSTPADTTQYTTGPCADHVVDVKLQEAGLPWYFWAAGVPTIHAHARAALLPNPPQGGLMPLGVPEENPYFAEVYYYDESTGTQIASAPLTSNGVDGSGHPVWDDHSYLDASGIPGLPVDFKGHGAVGVRVAFSASQNTTTNLTGNMTTDCSQTLVSCYDTPTSPDYPGLLHIRTFGNTNATPTSPLLRDVQLVADTGSSACSDPYFSNPATGTTCTVTIQADVDFADTSGNKPGGASVCAILPSSQCNKNPLTYRGTGASAFGAGHPCSNLTLVKATDECWTASGNAALTVNANAGMQRIDLQFSDNAMGNGNSGVTVSNVQRTYTTVSTGSGPVLFADSYIVPQTGPQAGSPQLDYDSTECDTTATSCVQHLFATFHLLPSFQIAQSTSDPPVLLRTAGNGAQTQTIQCWTGPNNYKTQVQNGCPETYTPNTGGATCPTQTPAAPPYQCVSAGTGQTTDIIDALDQRIEGSTSSCPNPNNWSTFSTLTAIQQNASTDPRRIFVIMTPVGSFAGQNAGKSFPVLDIGEFYITYWQGANGHPDPCGNSTTGDGSYTSSDPFYDGPLQGGDILGHFVTRFQINPNGNPGPGSCSLASLGGCALYMTQ